MIKLIKSFRRKRKIKAFQSQNDSKIVKKENPYFSKNKKYKNSLNTFFSWLKKDGWALLGIIILLLTTIWYFGFYSSKFVITEVNIAETQFIAKDQIKNLIDDYKQKKILWIIPRDRYWTLNTEKLQNNTYQKLLNTYAIESLEIQKKFPNKLNVNIQERIPSIAWITISKNKKTQKYYTVDRKGIVTQEIIKKEDIHPAFPQITDLNRTEFDIGWQVISAPYIEFILDLQEKFTARTSLEINHYIFPEIMCQERQYVAQEIFEQEILESASDEFKDKKRTIQEQFKEGLLTIDQSLESLENIKNEELVNLGELKEGEDSYQKTEWKTTYLETECDFVKVAADVHILTKGENGGFSVYFDSRNDLEQQLNNLQTVLNGNINNRNEINYIDVRMLSRVYYK